MRNKSDRAHVSDEGVIIHVLYRPGPKRKPKGKENLLLVPWSQRSFLGDGGWGLTPVDSSKKLATGRKYARGSISRRIIV